ncbi:MAG: hypothetical protein HYX72_00295 [Acidobacteria bacterium]|nr:hypothetical protein [Acidobacteriota bacterium]
MREMAAQRKHQAGSTLFMVAASLGVLLGMSALSIDLVSMYVARNEAQRAADAGALAGATVFVSHGCTVGAGGCVPGGPQEAPATQQAVAAAAQSLVVGQYPDATTVDVSFSYPSPQEPQITVTVNRDTAHGNAVGTYFAKALGINTVDISASAKAEAFDPTGSDIPIGVQCLRPFLVPNCDPVHPTPASPGCDTAAGYFFDPDTRQIVHPGLYNPSDPAGGGVQGEPWTLHTDSGPSQWYLIAFEGQSANDLRTYISRCYNGAIQCGTQQLSMNGANTGPTAQAVLDLIHANGSCMSGQDTIDTTTGPPFVVTGGANNPNPSLVGQQFYALGGASDSIVTVAVYDSIIDPATGQPTYALPPAGTTVTVVGFMQLFIRQVTKDPGNPCGGNGKNIEVTVLNITTCGNSVNNSTPPVITSGSAIPIRLIR